MKRKQIIVLGLVLVIIAVGILQYNYGDAGDHTMKIHRIFPCQVHEGDDKDSGAAVYVNGEADTQISMMKPKTGSGNGLFC